MSTVLQAAEQMELSSEARAELQPSISGSAAVRALIERELIQDALKLQARLLPKRYAVAWLCQCARGQPLSFEDKAGSLLAEQWVRDPSEANRRAAFEFANRGGYRTCGTWIAAAAGWSGGSLAPVSQSVPVPPPDHLTAKAAVAAVNLLAALVESEFDARRLAFIEHAMTLLGDAPAGGLG